MSADRPSETKGPARTKAIRRSVSASRVGLRVGRRPLALRSTGRGKLGDNKSRLACE